MKRKTVFDDRAVAPVISVILMVAIAVILAAVIATVVLGFGEDTEAAPPSAFVGEQGEEYLVASGGNSADFWTVTLRYGGGENIDEDQVSVLINGEQAYGVENTTGGCATSTCHEAIELWTGSGTITAGDTVTVVHKPGGIAAGDRYDICTQLNTCPGTDTDNPDTSRLWRNSQATSGTELQLTEGDTVQVVWESDSGETTAILYEKTIE